MEMLQYELRCLIYEFEGRSIVSEIDIYNKKNNLKELKRVFEWITLNSQLYYYNILKLFKLKIKKDKIDKVYTEELETFVQTWTINLEESTIDEIKRKYISNNLYLNIYLDSGLMLDLDVWTIEFFVDKKLVLVSAALTPNALGEGFCSFELCDEDKSFVHQLELIIVSL